MLLPEEEEAWFNVTRSRPTEAVRLLHPYLAALMEAYAVDRRVNIPTIEDPALLNSL